MPAETRDLHDNLKHLIKKFSSLKITLLPDGTPVLTTQSEDLTEMAERLRDDPELRFDHLSCVAAVDYLDHFVVVYQLFSSKKDHRLTVKVPISREEPEIPSVIGVWATADWQEREQHEMFGIVFEGHPNLKPLLLTDDFPGFPMRRDFPNENLEDYLLEDKRPDYIPLPGIEE